MTDEGRMKRAIHLLRAAFWWAIIADAICAVLMLFPDTYLEAMNLHLPASGGFADGLAFALPLMVGWTVLLLWADRKPLARKDVLSLTLIVVAGYVVVQVHNVYVGVTDLLHTLPAFASQAGLTTLIVVAYSNARRLEASPGFARGGVASAPVCRLSSAGSPARSLTEASLLNSHEERSW